MSGLMVFSSYLGCWVDPPKLDQDRGTQGEWTHKDQARILQHWGKKWRGYIRSIGQEDKTGRKQEGEGHFFPFWFH